MINMELLTAQLKIDEGVRLKPYLDTVGKTTIGIGRNISDVGISIQEAEFLLKNDVLHVIDALDKSLPWWRDMTEPRQRVLANMCFNLGITKLLTFKNTLRDMKDGFYDLAANGMLNSLWARQVGERANRLARIMVNG